MNFLILDSYSSSNISFDFLFVDERVKSFYISYSWPTTGALTFYVISLCGLFYVSAFAHLFNCISLRIRHLCFILDYVAITTYSAATAFAYCFYSSANSYFFHSISIEG